MWREYISSNILKLDSRINGVVANIRWYNRLAIIGLAYWFGVAIKHIYLLMW